MILTFSAGRGIFAFYKGVRKQFRLWRNTQLNTWLVKLSGGNAPRDCVGRVWVWAPPPGWQLPWLSGGGRLHAIDFPGCAVCYESSCIRARCAPHLQKCAAPEGCGGPGRCQLRRSGRGGWTTGRPRFWGALLFGADLYSCTGSSTGSDRLGIRKF